MESLYEIIKYRFPVNTCTYILYVLITAVMMGTETENEGGGETERGVGPGVGVEMERGMVVRGKLGLALRELEHGRRRLLKTPEPVETLLIPGEVGVHMCMYRRFELSQLSSLSSS